MEDLKSISWDWRRNRRSMLDWKQTTSMFLSGEKVLLPEQISYLHDDDQNREERNHSKHVFLSRITTIFFSRNEIEDFLNVPIMLHMLTSGAPRRDENSLQMELRFRRNKKHLQTVTKREREESPERLRCCYLAIFIWNWIHSVIK